MHRKHSNIDDHQHCHISKSVGNFNKTNVANALAHVLQHIVLYGLVCNISNLTVLQRGNARNPTSEDMHLHIHHTRCCFAHPRYCTKIPDSKPATLNILFKPRPDYTSRCTFTTIAHLLIGYGSPKFLQRLLAVLRIHHHAICRTIAS